MLRKFNYLFITLFLSCVGSSLQAQPWLSNLPSGKNELQKTNFYDLDKAFEKYWNGKNLDDKKVTKGKGYKPFKRWENWMIPRAYPNGIIPVDQTWKEFQKEKLKKTTKSSPVSNWTPDGPFNVPNNLSSKATGLGRINCVAFHPANQNILYTGSPSGGFWKTTNGGQSWITTTDELPSLGISDIVIHPQNPEIIYIATGDGDAGDTYSTGILKSENGGISWNSTGLTYSTSENKTIRRLLINPEKPDTLIAAASTGIYFSSDAGITWTLAKSGNFKDIEFNSGNHEIVYAARYGTNSARFYKSVDGGFTFSEILTGVALSETYRLELAVGSNTGASVVYALYTNKSDDGFHSLWKSQDNGNTWNKIYDKSGLNLLGWTHDGSDEGGQGWYDLSLVVSPLNAEEVYVGGINIWKSINSGENWNLVSDWDGTYATYIHADHHYLVFNASGTLFSGNDGGLYKSTTQGQTWTDISNGLSILQTDRIGLSQTNPNICIVGNQDNGTMKYDAQADKWIQILPGDGCECIVDFTNEDTIYYSYIKGDIRRSDDGGLTNIPIKPAGAGEGIWHTPFIMQAGNNNVLYAGYEDLWKTADKGNTWQKISNNLSPGSPLRQIAVAASNPDYIFVTNGIKLWKTSDGGNIWNQIINENLSGLFITYFAFDNQNQDKCWLTVSGYTELKKVFYTEDGGVNWYNYSEGLPNVPVNCIVREDNSNDVLYLGTDIGVYYRDASMHQWERFSTGLPNVEISELEIQYSSSSLFAGTRGRGLYHTPISLSNTYKNIITECFDGNSLPASWKSEVIANPAGNIPQLDFITESVNPTGFIPVKCSNFARFNSFTCEENDKLRLSIINALSATENDSMHLSFYLGTDNEYPENNDSLITQWSENGTTWHNIDTFLRYNADGDKWLLQTSHLPDEAENLPSLFIGFLFISSYGNDIHFDNINFDKVLPDPPRYISSFTNESGVEIEIIFNQDMSDPAGKEQEFSVDTGNSIVPVAINLNPLNNKSYLLQLPFTLKQDQEIKLSYNQGSITSANGGVLETFVDKITINKVKNPTGIANEEIKSVFSVYPNPNKGEFEICINKQLCNNSGLKIYNASGSLVYNKLIGDLKKNEILRVKLNNGLHGIFHLSLESCEKIYKQTLIIE
ncbi:MAG: T9SS type A sorting domain-containing protein [Bacteroidales bacterium]